MASIWTIKPETETYDLTWTTSDGVRTFWIKVKKRLSVGEQRKVLTAGWKGIRANRQEVDSGTEIQVDWQSQSFARAEIYLVDWSLEDDAHNRLPIDRTTLEALHSDVFGLIENAINAHVGKGDQEKKASNGDDAPAPTSA